MSRKFLTSVDMALNSILNVIFQPLASDPGSPASGQIWYNTTSKVYKYYDGTAVQTFGTGTGSGNVTQGSNSASSGILKVSAGADKSIGDYAGGTGLVKSNSSGVVSAAVAGTDYAAATTGSSALKGNGSGGFGAAVLNDVGAATGDYSLNSHKITSLADPASAQDAATKSYVDAVIQGLQFKPTATVAATSALPAGTYSNGSSGVGATFTVTATGTTTVDGHVVAAGDLVLATAQASAFQNGLYAVTTAGTTGVSTVLTRHADMDQAAEFPGAMVPVGSTGTANANSLWLANPSGTVTVGTTSIPFTELNKGTDLAAGTGIAISGNTVSIENSGVLLPAHGGTGAASLTGIVKANGASAATAAVAGTDYAAATSGSSMLGANGSGGFRSAKFTATIGDGSTTSIAVTHSLGTADVIAQVRDASTNAVVDCDIVQTSTTVTTFGFTAAPASNAYKVVIIG